MSEPQDLPRLYRVSSGLASTPWLFFAGGVGLVAVAVCGFLLAVRAGTGPLQLHLTSTLPMILAVGLFATGYCFARSPREVAIGQEGLRIRSCKAAERLLGWDDVAWSEVQTQATTNRKLLAIYGTNGKVLLRLPSNLDGFEELSAAIRHRLDDHPSPHAAAVRWRKSRRNAIALLAGTVLALAGAGWLAWMTHDAHRSAELMRSQGVDGEAVVVRKFVAPDGRTRRIEYRVAGAGDDAKLHNVEVLAPYWDALEVGARVPVVTVPGHPEIARLRAGEVKDEFLNPSPATNMLLGLALLVMAALFLVGAILGFKGMDIASDPTTGKLRIERLPPLPATEKHV